MASSRNRQRQLARAKLDRQTARRASKARRRRQLRAGIAVTIALIVIVVGALWLGGVFDSKPAPTPTSPTTPGRTPSPVNT
jgi:peptidyl-prolyl cis-trans isomerase B (cyclophilin B)